MNITKIKIRNLFGITEYEAGGQSVELSGKNGVGKTSVIDAIKYALTNRSDREYIVRNGETEGEILIETDSGLSIRRKPRTNQTDYKSVKRNGAEVQGPESFLKDIFAELQLQPMEFMAMESKQQNRIILDMIEFDWDMNWIKEQFGEIPPEVSYDQNILSVLHDIQAENGYYYRYRQDLNRDIRNKGAFVEEIAAALPPQYDCNKWENANLSELYVEIERIRKENELIEKAKALHESRNNKVRKYEADREIALAALDREVNGRSSEIDKEIADMESRIRELRSEKSSLESRKKDKAEAIESKYRADIAQYDATLDEYRQYLEKEPKPVDNLLAQAGMTEEMKSYVNEYKRMENLQNEVDRLREESEELTRKIEKARDLPGEILQTATIPVENLTIKDGIPLINGLPISNLSEGEKLDLCIDIAIQKPGGLKIILIDGVEKLASDLREQLYRKCKEKGLQFIATRTTDDDTLNVVEL